MTDLQKGALLLVASGLMWAVLYEDDPERLIGLARLGLLFGGMQAAIFGCKFVAKWRNNGIKG